MNIINSYRHTFVAKLEKEVLEDGKMMMTAYNELYLDDAMQNLGDMIDFAVCDLGYDPDEFFGWFISSNIASKFEKGNPKYVAGMSGYELAETIYHEADVSKFVESANEIIARNKKYEI